MGPARLRCQLLRDAAVRHKMGPVSGAHPVLARLTPWRTSRDPRTRGCVTSIFAEGCHLYIALTGSCRIRCLMENGLAVKPARSVYYSLASMMVRTRKVLAGSLGFYARPGFLH